MYDLNKREIILGAVAAFFGAALVLCVSTSPADAKFRSSFKSYSAKPSISKTYKPSYKATKPKRSKAGSAGFLGGLFAGEAFEDDQEDDLILFENEDGSDCDLGDLLEGDEDCFEERD